MERNLKCHKSVQEQIQILQKHGLIVEDKEEAKRILESLNYYKITGYLYQYRETFSSCYRPGTSFRQIIGIYHFDCKLNRLLMYALEDIEESFKTKFSYVLSSLFPNNPLIYLDISIYRDADALERFRGIFDSLIRSNKNLPFIKHHIEKYGGKLPIWVAIEILTMGNILYLYKNLKGCYQKAIASLYHTGSVQMQSWIENITYTRNHLAHYMRMYGYNFGRTPAICRNHKGFMHTGKIFDQIMIISFMFSDNKEWNSYVLPELIELIEEYKSSIELASIGFPNDWIQLLTL